MRGNILILLTILWVDWNVSMTISRETSNSSDFECIWNRKDKRNAEFLDEEKQPRESQRQLLISLTKH